MSLSPISAQTVRFFETEKTQVFPTSCPFAKATQSLSSLFKHIEESPSLADVQQLRREITLLRNASLEDRRQVLAANRLLDDADLHIVEFSELERGREMEAQIDALMQQATQLISLHVQGEEAQKVLKITSPQTEFERDWDFAKCLYEEGLPSESIAIIKQTPLPDNVQKFFDLIVDSPTQEKLEEFFQFAELENTRKYIKTVSDELYRPKILADVLSHPTIMNVFLKYVDPVTLMRLNSPCDKSVKQVLPNEYYAEMHAKKALDIHSFSLSAAPVVCRNLIPIALAALWQNGLEYQYLDPELQKDIGIAKIALVSIIEKGIDADLEILMSLFSEHIRLKLFEYLSDIKEAFSKRDIQNKLEEKGKNIPYLKFLADVFIKKFPNDKDICRIMVQVSGCSLEHASSAIQNDPEIVMFAVTENGWALKYASGRLKNDEAIVKAAVTNDGNAIEFASAKLQDNYDIVMAAVSGYQHKSSSQDDEDLEYALSHASKRLQDNYDIVMAAVSKRGHSLLYASKRLQDNYDIVLAAVTQIGLSLQYVSERLKNKKEIVMAAVSHYQWALEFSTSKRLQDNYDIVMAAVKNYGSALEGASDRLRDDENIVRAAITNDPKAIEFASARVRAILNRGIERIAYPKLVFRNPKVALP